MAETASHKAWRIKNAELIRQRRRERYAANRDAAKKATRDWRLANPEKAKETQLRYRLANPEKRQINGRRRHGIIDPPVGRPSGACAICARWTEKLDCDHCHKTGRFRAWLCRTCNVGLGHIERSDGWLQKAYAYLESHSKPAE